MRLQTKVQSRSTTPAGLCWVRCLLVTETPKSPWIPFPELSIAIFLTDNFVITTQTNCLPDGYLRYIFFCGRERIRYFLCLTAICYAWLSGCYQSRME